MKYTDDQLNEAVKNEIFSSEQIDQFREFIKNSNSQVSKIHKVLYYGGGLLIILAMTWLMATSWSIFGATGLAVVSALYFILFLLAGYFVYFKKKMELAGGILFSVSILITPLFLFSLLQIFEFWPERISLLLEISVILVALPILFKTRFPFIVFLIVGALWAFSMDIVLITFEIEYLTWANLSIIFGLCMIGIGYFSDFKFKKDYAFWMYLFGLITLLFGLSVFYMAEIYKFVLPGIISLLLILFSLFINRTVFLVFGTIGLTEFLCLLSWRFFEGSLLFPFAVTIIGILLIIFGILVQKNRKNIEEKFIKKLPLFLLNLRPKRNT